MEFLSKELVSFDYVQSLQQDLAKADVCRFLVAYASKAGTDSIGRHLLSRALRDERSFGVASLSCSCGYEPLLRLQDDLDDVRLKYFMDPIVEERLEPSEIALFHSKLVYLCLPRESKSVVYLGSHNWTRRALGRMGPRNAEASVRLEFEFEEDHLVGVGSSVASEVNRHLMTAWDTPLCLPATRANEATFREWSAKACQRNQPVPLQSQVVLLAVLTGGQAPDWSSLDGGSIYLQVLSEDDGNLIWDKANNRLLVMVWESANALQTAQQPILLRCRISTSVAGANSTVRGSNQSSSPVDGFEAVIWDDTELASRHEERFERRPPLSIWSGRPVEYYDFEFPTIHTGSASVDGNVDPNYRFLLEVEAVVMPAGSNLEKAPGMVWTSDSFAVAASREAARVEEAPGYFVDAELGREMIECLENTLFIDPHQAKVLPYSDEDRSKFGKRVSKHALHETYLGSQLSEKERRDAYYRESDQGSLVAELDVDQLKDDKSELVPRIQRVFTSPIAKLLDDWRERAQKLYPKEKNKERPHE